MNLELAGFDEGDILKFKGILYSHYAVYVGNDEIIHYQPTTGKLKILLKIEGSAIIIKESIQSYWAREGRKYPVEATLGLIDELIVLKTYTGSEVVRRAESKVGREKYSALFENCEAFVNWCKYDLKMSNEVEKKVMQIGTPTVAASGIVGGAIIGGMAGSVVPVVGTVIGGVIGGAIGFVAGAVTGSGGFWAANKVARKVKAEVKSGDDL